jgi:PAS domain S-box-containing protein
MKILLVEDNAITRKLVRVTLRAESHDVLEAPDARTALELAAQGRPDVILQDLRLPDMDGFELLRRLREIPGCADVPIIAFSGLLSRLEEARAASVGFNDFLVKPVLPAELVRTVQAHQPRRSTAEGAGARKVVLLADDDPVQRKLGRMCLELHGFKVETAADGMEALELARTKAVDVIVSDVLMPRLDGFGLCLAVRKDRRLGRMPVVLCSNTYLDGEDEALARRMGANAFVIRTADMQSVVGAVQEAISRGGTPVAAGVADELRDTHVYRVITQLEHHAVINAGLARRCTSQSAALAILGTISDTLAKSLDTGLDVDEVLSSVLEAGGFSVGVLYLLDEAGRLAVQAQSGYHDTSRAEVEALFGHESLFRDALESGTPLAIPSAGVDERTAQAFLARTGPAAALILPILFREERLGVLLVATDLTDLTGEESLDFARTVGHQIGQVVALRRTFARMATAEQEYRGIFEHAVEGIFRSTAAGRHLLVNPAMAKIYGYESPQDMLATVRDIGRQLYADPRDRDELLRRLGAEGAVSRFECRGLRKDGTIFWVSQSVREIRDDGGRILYHEGVLEDVTERKRAEAATTALAATARGLLESLDVVAVTRLVTEHVCRLLGATSATVYRLDAATGDFVTLGEPPAERSQFWTARLPAGTGMASLAVRDGKPHAAPDVLRYPGVRFTGEARAALEATDQRATLAVPLVVGRAVFGSLIIRDRVGRTFEPAEIALAQAFADQAAIALDKARLFQEAQAGRDFLGSVTQNSADAIVAADARGRVTFFSQRAEEIWGRPAGAVLDQPLADLLGESDQAQGLLARLRVQARIQNREITVRGADGAELELSVSLAALHDASGQVSGLVAVARDVTERKRTEAALRQSEKLAAMSSLAAGVAHELNNPLSVILAHSTMLASGGGRLPLPERANKIVRAAQRCARLVKNFLALARQHPPERQRVALDQVIRDTLELVAYQLRVDGIAVTLDLAPELPVLWADPHQFQQVVLNLVTNAHHELRAIQPPRAITITARLQASHHLRLSVADNGPGIPPAVRDRIFEPFFTTKPVGQGTGLGLSLCRAIVEGHGGTLELESAPGRGAEFTILLPVIAPPADAPAPFEAPEPARGLRILVVDDEPDVADVLVGMLEADGHRAEVASNGKVALERLTAGAFDVVMSDLRMPELDGPSLYRTLQSTGHPMARRFVFITGDVLGPQTAEFLGAQQVPAISKPCSAQELRAVLRQALARPGA